MTQNFNQALYMYILHTSLKFIVIIRQKVFSFKILIAVIIIIIIIIIKAVL